MIKKDSQIKVAVVQAAPVLFNCAATIEKACNLIHEAAAQGAQFILFPESFIPAYPRGLSFGMVVGSRTAEGRSLWEKYWKNSIDIPGYATDILGTTAKDANVYVAIGVTERDKEYSRGTLFCTLLYFGPSGEILGKHRKLKATGAERMIWGEGDGSTLPVFDTALGKIGGLICWENYMPLARMAMYSKGVEIYLAPTADSRDTWQATLCHIACEGRCFVLGCNQFITRDMYPEEIAKLDEINKQPEVMCRGGSVIISPLGDVLAGPLYGRESILYADLDMDDIIRSKVDFDVVGHYARSDVFSLVINEKPSHPIKKE